MIRLTMVAVLGLVAVSPLLARGEDAAVVAGDLGKKLDEAVSAAVGPDFWGSVLVARDGEILLARGYGFADYRERPNTPATLFELASASKQVAAVAILHLCRKKKLSPEQTLGSIFKEVPGDKRDITVHQLLTHTSGISGRIGVPYDSTIARKEYVKAMLAKPLASAPGTKFEYCNVGYALLAAVVEEVSRKSFEDYVRKNLFKPAKLDDTGFIGDRELIRSERVSHRKKGRIPDATAANWHWGWGYRGMGGVVTTVLDLLKWDRALRGEKILSDEWKKILYTPVRAGYACGWKVDTTERGTRKAHHSGGVAGYGVNVVRYLEEDVAIFVLSNGGRGAFAATGAAERVLFPPVQLTATIDFSPYEPVREGIYDLPQTITFKVERAGGSLVLRVKDGDHTVLEIRAPVGYGQKLITSLTQAIAAREADDDGGAAKTEAGLYLQAYNCPVKLLMLCQQLRFDILPEYRGRKEDGTPVVDRRVLLRLVDERYGWPFMAKLNVAAARALLVELRSAHEE